MGSQNQLGPLPGGNASTKNITATTVIKATAGRVYTVSVVVAGSAAGSVYDNNSTSAGNTAANQIGTIPDTVGQVPFYGFPTSTGITLVPGTGQTLAISWS